jgi:hypothetical protein
LTRNQKKQSSASQSIAQWFAQLLDNLINGKTVHPIPANSMHPSPQNGTVISTWLTPALGGVSLATQAANKPVAP